MKTTTTELTDAEIIDIAMREDPGNLDNGTYWMFGRATLLRIVRAVLDAETKKEDR